MRSHQGTSADLNPVVKSIFSYVPVWIALRFCSTRLQINGMEISLFTSVGLLNLGLKVSRTKHNEVDFSVQPLCHIFLLSPQCTQA